MARLVGIDLPRNKRIEIGLTYIYGIGLTTSKKILAETGINPDTRTDDPDGDRLLPRPSPSSRSARSRPAYAHERSHAQGSP